MPDRNKIRVVLFDLGGVLLRLNDPVGTFGLPGSLTEFKALWLKSAAVREFEAGRIDTEQFAKKVVVETQMPYGWQEFIERFNSWPDQLFDRTLGLLQEIPREYRLALLSNINSLHWERENIARLLEGLFDRTFLSYLTGHVKPDRESFAQVTKFFDCRPDEVLFFDDSHGNVEAAGEFGMQAVNSVGIEAVEAALRERSILS